MRRQAPAADRRAGRVSLDRRGVEVSRCRTPQQIEPVRDMAALGAVPVNTVDNPAVSAAAGGSRALAQLAALIPLLVPDEEVVGVVRGDLESTDKVILVPVARAEQPSYKPLSRCGCLSGR